MSNSRYAIGLDVGGTKIAGGLVDVGSGELAAKQIIPTRAARGGQAVLDDALTLAVALLEEATTHNLTVRGIGMGICELVDLLGRITSDYNFDWRNLPVQEQLATLAPPTIVESDVRAAALAEARWGAGQPYRLFAYVTVGTGISYTLIQDGKPFAGARGNALLLATMPLTMTCTACGTVLNQVLEEFASGPALVERYNKQADAHISSGEEVMNAIQQGDPIATDIVRSAGAALGNSVGFLANILDPEAIIVGGGLGLAGGLYWDSFVQSTREHIYAADTRDLPILPASLGVDAGIIGAAASVMSNRSSNW